MRIEAVRGDITTQEVDAIVNAANSGLLGGGGVDGAIHRAAGPRLLQACRELRATSLPDGLPVGEAVATPGFDLPARWVIHTVGPNRHAGQTDPALLRAAFRSSLELAQELGCRSVAMPAISAGVYGWDADAVARAAVTEARALAARTDTTSGVEVCGTDVVDAAAEQARGLELVRFVLFSDRLLRAFQTALDA
ncbi:O-acetyl-ADP-ribose deacetylase [Actinomyces succiniciruminis]|uniref:Macro domain-containing protein in non 5'region n=1 Tax=Actinomyces succiniciruminis TaxID=1522002 RepID=A0A1L7RP45_9ACTO|nr:O-acetyl-ADP-ribose deacetylase [Actinomyces succiniciruminis]CED90893.1 Macro domain-containing protein in non 5'region [Actinomyces succiniciruminis]